MTWKARASVSSSLTEAELSRIALDAEILVAASYVMLRLTIEKLLPELSQRLREQDREQAQRNRGGR
jgi:hypothetical protein